MKEKKKKIKRKNFLSLRWEFRIYSLQFSYISYSSVKHSHPQYFILLVMSSKEQKFSILMKSNTSNFSFSDHAFSFVTTDFA